LECSVLSQCSIPALLFLSFTVPMPTTNLLQTNKLRTRTHYSQLADYHRKRPQIMMKTLIGVQVCSDNATKIIKIPLTCNLYLLLISQSSPRHFPKPCYDDPPKIGPESFQTLKSNSLIHLQQTVAKHLVTESPHKSRRGP
jgi:hypothetical protein